MATLYQCDRCHQQSTSNRTLRAFTIPPLPYQRMDGGATGLESDCRDVDLCADCLDSLSRWLEAGAE